MDAILKIPKYSSISMAADAERMNYPQGAVDDPTYATVYMSKSQKRAYGYLDGRVFAHGPIDSMDVIRNMAVGDNYQCGCGAILCSAADLYLHRGVHVGDSKASEDYLAVARQAKVKRLSWDDVRKNVARVLGDAEYIEIETELS